MQIVHVPRSRLVYLIDKEIAPVCSVEPGAWLEIATEDAYSGVYQEYAPLDPDRIALPQGGNPVVGPIYVQGVSPDDTLVISIDDIQVEGPCVSHFAGSPPWSSIGAAPSASRFEVGDGVVFVGDRSLPLQPMIGTIGLAPAGCGLASVESGPNGGNLDCPQLGPGATLYLPVAVSGGLLFVGDVHARQGDGELFAALEARASVRLRVDAISGRSIRYPRITTPTHRLTIGSSKDVESAFRQAIGEMLRWLTDDLAIAPDTAFRILGYAADLGVCQWVQSPYTVKVSLPRAYTPSNGREAS